MPLHAKLGDINVKQWRWYRDCHPLSVTLVCCGVNKEMYPTTPTDSCLAQLLAVKHFAFV